MNPRDVIRATECVYFLPAGSILKHCRTRTVAEARAVSQYIIRKHTRFSWHEIADVYKHHYSSIIHNYQKINRIVKAESQKETCNNILNIMYDLEADCK